MTELEPDVKGSNSKENIMRRSLLVVFFWLSVGSVSANNIDSLRIVLEYQMDEDKRLQTLYALSRAYLVSGDTSGLSFWKEGFELAMEKDDSKYLADHYYLKGYFERGFRSNHADAFVSFSLAQELYEEISDEKLFAFSTLLIAEYHAKIGEYATAEKLYRDTEIKLLEVNDVNEIGRLHKHLGHLYENKGDLIKAIDEFTIAASYLNQSENWILLTSSLNHLGRIHRELGSTKEAMIAFEHALKLAIDKSNSPLEQSFAAFNLAWVSWEEDSTYPAEEQLREAYALALEYDPTDTETFRMADLLADFYWEQNQTEQALAMLLTQAEYMPEAPNETQQLVYHQLVRLYEATDQLDLALATTKELMAGQ
ncbi:MAG TPA: hypothetical protein DCE41_17640, partial [Cytophagales bacterium]|nr:hypothetical protein [Cytophagales bacterium]